MSLPKLQIACDHNDLASALADIKAVGDVVDIIEAGTILLLQDGAEVVRCFRALYPDKLIVADPKCADAGGTVAKNLERSRGKLYDLYLFSHDSNHESCGERSR